MASPSPTGSLSPAPSSGLSSRRSSVASKNLHLDLSTLPPLVQPTPPSNTLLFTNLSDLDIFRPDNLQSIRDLVSHTAPIHSFAPLKSFRRILVSFFTTEDAVAVRRVWDGEAVMGDRIRVYFGEPTSLQLKDEHLALPDAGKLFFISPPPSPPCDWEMRMEDAPNKTVHAEDLADALARLHQQRRASLNSPKSDGPVTPAGEGSRSRSSTLIYVPEDHGSAPTLPSVVVCDMTDEPEDMDMCEGKTIGAHTSRPPLELMQA